MTIEERLGTTAISVMYEFCDRIGQLHMPDGCCCDMTGCIELFEGIDSKVKAIRTFAGEKPDTEYRKHYGKWKAISHR